MTIKRSMQDVYLRPYVSSGSLRAAYLSLVVVGCVGLVL